LKNKPNRTYSDSIDNKLNIHNSIFSKYNKNNTIFFKNEFEHSSTDIDLIKNITTLNIPISISTNLNITTTDMDAYLRPVSENYDIQINDLPISFKKSIFANIQNSISTGITRDMFLKNTNNLNSNLYKNFNLVNKLNSNILLNQNNPLFTLSTENIDFENNREISTSFDNFGINSKNSFGSLIPISKFLDLDRIDRDGFSY